MNVYSFNHVTSKPFNVLQLTHIMGLKLIKGVRSEYYSWPDEMENQLEKSGSTAGVDTLLI